MSSKPQPFNFERILNKIIIYLPIGVAIHLFVSLYVGDFKTFLTVYKIDFVYLIAALFVALLPWYLHSWRIHNLTVFIKQPTDLKTCFKIAVGVDLGAAITPTAFGGSPVKIGMYMDEGIKPAKAISLTLFTSIEDTAFFIISTILAFVFVQPAFLHESFNLLKIHINLSQVLIGVGITLVAILIIYFLMRLFGRNLLAFSWFRKIYRLYLATIRDIIKLLILIAKEGKKVFFINVTLAVVQWISKYLVMYFLLLGIGIEMPFLEVFLLQIVIFILMNFVPTPGAAVGAETIFYIVFSQFLPTAIILPITSAWRLLTFYLQLAIGSGIFIFLNNKKLKIETEEA